MWGGMLRKKVYTLLKWPFFHRFMVEWRNPLDAEEYKKWIKDTIKSDSGARIRVMASKCDANTRGVMVLAHPMGKEAKGYFLKRKYSDLYKRNGYHVVVFDFNGFGESTQGSFSYESDVLAVGKYAANLFPDLPLGYHGVSFGGMWGIIAFKRHHPYTFALVESAATSLGAFCKLFPVYNIMYKALAFLFFRLEREVNMINQVKHIKKLNRVLFLYTSIDEWVPLKMGEEYHEKCAIPSELWVTNTARHGEIIRSQDKIAYQQKVISFCHEQTFKKNITNNKQINSWRKQPEKIVC